MTVLRDYSSVVRATTKMPTAARVKFVEPQVVRQRTHDTKSFVAKVDDSQWTWRELRDYCVAEIEQRHGAINRDPIKESGIFKGFLKRWGKDAVRIARCAFDAHDGVWNGQPIDVARFCSNNDPYFACVIAERFRASC